MSPKFVLRFDDIAPAMAWSKFAAFESLARDMDIPILMGVVPKCLDPNLTKESEKFNFWDEVRNWNSRNWTIAQHGYTHQYVTKNPGLLAVSNKSELAGLSYEEQYLKLSAGKFILQQQGVWQPVFMAPSHSFDLITLKVLVDLDFRYLTDGYGVYPYKIGSITAVPQLFASPANFGFGVYTICLHVNNMSEAQIQSVLHFIREHRKQFISFFEATTICSSVPVVPFVSRLLTTAALRLFRNVVLYENRKGGK